MPRGAGQEEAPRRSAPEAPRGQRLRPSTPLSREWSSVVEPRRVRSFPSFELALDHDGDGEAGDGRKQQGRHRSRSQGQHRQPRHQPRVVDVGCRGMVGVGFGRRSSFSYWRLPEQQLRLTVVKLDCTTFDVQVLKSASVSELKLAVEEIFNRPPNGECEISWSLVWGHFCLCYKDQKLIDDKAFLRTFGIRDGDELHFIRHVSINHNPIQEHTRKHGSFCEEEKMESTGSEVHQGSEEDGTDSDGIKPADDYSNYIDKNCDDTPHPEVKLAHSLRGWLSNSGSWLSGRAILGSMVRPSRLDSYFQKLGKDEIPG